ncbi:RusA family crossover junction endodeoxyribonuclease [Clostridium grantii]|uniref:Endodeoxyribonuclease RusA n=1 Tax=Clostridium grantii DSM 8605 TaxID=1121316 RepID=A0A1M5TGJ3_9CLOT|nr:RusA family crossover junction endodeoxyribonuclease [Clostridium grantii]SHH49872.1 Endodeoxyribonuclease RusA [Clostridium grantii DSM 8605]
MNQKYVKIIINGSPISKSNFKLSNSSGRSILPYASGKYHDRYALYEEEIAYQARLQNPNIQFTESLIAILKVYYKSKKRHPDTTNIPKSIFDGIEKSGIIINDAQIRKLVIEEFYDNENPRFELELFAESLYDIKYQIFNMEKEIDPIEYSLPSNKKSTILNKKKKIQKDSCGKLCEICGKFVSDSEIVSANKGQTLICRTCLKKLF